MTTGRRFRIGEKVVEYSLTRSKRRKKTVGIKVARGLLEVAAPQRTPVREIEDILRKREMWILERLEESSKEPPPRLPADGDILPCLGNVLMLAVIEGDVRRPTAQSEGQSLLVTTGRNLSDDERSGCTRAAVVSWYRSQALGFLESRVAHWLPLMGRVEVPRVLVREQKARWGSCSSDGTLRFSWRLAMLEPDLIDSVVVHELAHLQVMNHSPAFWEVVLDTMPDARERRKRLSEAGRRLPL